MEIKKKIEYKTTYIANDGTEFQSEEECRKYEETATCDTMFKALNVQHSYVADLFREYSSDDEFYAVEIKTADQLEIVNAWIKAHDIYNYRESLGDEAIGTIQIISLDWENNAWIIGTPEQMKNAYCEEIDHLFNKLIERSKGAKGEN